MVETTTIARSAIDEMSPPREPIGCGSAGQAPSGELAGCIVDAVGCLLVSKPAQQVAHPVFERRRRVEAQQLAGTLRVGNAMADVTGPILAVANRLDLGFQPGRKRLGDLQDGAGSPGAKVDRVSRSPVRLPTRAESHARCR